MNNQDKLRKAAEEVKIKLEKLNFWTRLWQSYYDNGDYQKILERPKEVLDDYEAWIRKEQMEEEARIRKIAALKPKADEIKRQLERLEGWNDYQQMLYDDQDYDDLIEDFDRFLLECREYWQEELLTLLKEELENKIELEEEKKAKEREAREEARSARNQSRGFGLLPGFLNFLGSLFETSGEALGYVLREEQHNSRKCNGDCSNCPSHYGYRYGRWYYGHGHMHGCERGGNGGASGRTLRD